MTARRSIPCLSRLLGRLHRLPGLRLRSMKSGLLKPFEQMVAGLLSAELSGESPCIEKRGEMHDDNALALGILVSSHLGIGGRKKRMRYHLDAESGAARDGAVTGLNRFAVTAEEIICLA
jgi:hypothetical protein